jgi:hypothetical protein
MSDYKTRLLERRKSFVIRWTERLQATTQSIDSLPAGDAVQLKSVTKDFHQLAGAAGIYELTDVCDKAIAAEELCATLVKTQSAPSANDVEMLRTTLSAIIDLLRAL